MKLENIVKYHSPRAVSPFFSPKHSSSESFSGSDIMAALGMANKRAPLGYSAFCGKMDLSQEDKRRAVTLLTASGLKESLHYPALRKMAETECLAVIEIMAAYAFLDYARSPESTMPCHACNSSGYRKGKRCTKCSGKGAVRAACKDCKGRGQSVNRMKTCLQGAPVYQHCKRCAGRGYERISSLVVFRAVCQVTQAISLDTWNKSVKLLLEFLVTELYKEESWAEKQFIRVTE